MSDTIPRKGEVRPSNRVYSGVDGRYTVVRPARKIARKLGYNDGRRYPSRPLISSETKSVAASSAETLNACGGGRFMSARTGALQGIRNPASLMCDTNVQVWENGFEFTLYSPAIWGEG